MAESSSRGKFVIASGLFLLVAAGWIWLEQDESEKGPASVQPARVRPSSSEPALSVPSEPAPEADSDAMMPPPPVKPAEVEQPPASSADAKADPARDQSWIRARYEEAQLRRTAIKAIAIREHRRLNAEEFASSWAIEFEFQDEIGTDAYDQLMYDLGRKNRVRVNWVAPGSYAAEAGVMRGDIILSYGDDSVFSPQSVRQRDRLLDPNQQIVVEVERDGAVLRLTMNPDEEMRGRSGIVYGMTLIPFLRQP